MIKLVVSLCDQVIRVQGRPGRCGRRACVAGAPKHRQRFLSVRPGGWSRPPVNSSGTRLTLALGGGLEGPPRPAITPYPFPSASSVGVGRQQATAHSHTPHTHKAVDLHFSLVSRACRFSLSLGAYTPFTTVHRGYTFH